MKNLIIEVKRQLKQEGLKKEDMTAEAVCKRLNELGIPFLGYRGKT